MTTALPPRRTIEILGVAQKIGVAVVTLVLAALAVMIWDDVFRQPDLDTTERVIGGVIGLGFGLMAVLFLIDLPGMLGRHRLEFDHDGLAYDVWISRVKSFRVSWAELASVSLSTAEKRSRASRSTFVRLDMTPVDPVAFAARHPEMDVLRGDGGAEDHVWRLGFGPNPRRIPPIVDALRAYGGSRYRGIEDDGRASAWTYR